MGPVDVSFSSNRVDTLAIFTLDARLPSVGASYFCGVFALSCLHYFDFADALCCLHYFDFADALSCLHYFDFADALCCLHYFDFADAPCSLGNFDDELDDAFCCLVKLDVAFCFKK